MQKPPAPNATRARSMLFINTVTSLLWDSTSYYYLESILMEWLLRGEVGFASRMRNGVHSKIGCLALGHRHCDYTPSQSPSTRLQFEVYTNMDPLARLIHADGGGEFMVRWPKTRGFNWDHLHIKTIEDLESTEWNAFTVKVNRPRGLKFFN